MSVFESSTRVLVQKPTVAGSIGPMSDHVLPVSVERKSWAFVSWVPASIVLGAGSEKSIEIESFVLPPFDVVSRPALQVNDVPLFVGTNTPAALVSHP